MNDSTIKNFWLGIGRLESSNNLIKEWHILHIFIVNLDCKFDQSTTNSISKSHANCLAIINNYDLDSLTHFTEKKIRHSISSLSLEIDKYLENIDI
jgi:hypothetical protein